MFTEIVRLCSGCSPHLLHVRWIFALLASSFGRSVALWSSLELSNYISPLLHYKGNNNNSCTYHTEDFTEEHDAKMT